MTILDAYVICITVSILRAQGEFLTHVGNPTERENEKQTGGKWIVCVRQREGVGRELSVPLSVQC